MDTETSGIHEERIKMHKAKICLGVSLVLTSIFAAYVIRLAFLERGYIAYGGEYLLIISCFILAFKLTWNMMDKFWRKKS